MRVGLGLVKVAFAAGDRLRDGGGLGIGRAVVAHAALVSIRRYIGMSPRLATS